MTQASKKFSGFKISGFKAAATAVALAVTLGTAVTPAMARDHYYGYGNDDRIDAGDVIAGAIIIGGIAAILSSGSGGRDRYDRYGGGYQGGYGDESRYYGGERYDRSRYGGSREAVNRCVSAAERQASYGNGSGGRADVTEITDIYRVRGGYEVRGRIVVQSNYRDRGNGYDQGYGYDRGNGYDRGYDRDRGYGRERSGYDGRYERGSFTCVARYGQVDGLRFHGLR